MQKNALRILVIRARYRKATNKNDLHRAPSFFLKIRKAEKVLAK